MLDMTQGDAAPRADEAPADAGGHAPARPNDEARGCLYALSQPPLMIFLGVIGCLLLLAALHDLYLL
ncbi:hypothetical protein ACWCP6_11110 [Streptomyces sp. NPDC002004]